MRLENKVAVVTGASRGIGKAIAIGLAKEGASVIVAARTETERGENLPGTIHQTVDEIKGLGARAIAVPCDVTDETSVSKMAETCLREFGKIDVLVNNAGVTFAYPGIETPLKRWELILKVNLTGAFICARAVLPSMMDQRQGSIINISSLAATERDGGAVKSGLVYGVSKAGLERFTWGLAAEVGQYNVAVNCLKPHRVVETEGLRMQVRDEAKRKGWILPEKMVRCAIFLAAQDAAGVTGVVATDNEFAAWHGLKMIT